MSSKKKIGIVIVVAVLAITFMTVAFLTTQTNTDYYTQIDNRWVTDIAPHGAMNYKYTLVAYDESGNAKDVTFETSPQGFGCSRFHQSSAASSVLV